MGAAETANTLSSDNGLGTERQDVVQHFWPLALELEDQALELARRRLEAALDALRQALENEAGEEVVRQRREDVQAAIDDYLQALAQSGQIEESSPGGGGEQLSTNSLSEMLDAIEDLSGAGANGAARQMLSDLESLLQNLRLTQGGGGGGGVPNPNGQSAEGDDGDPSEGDDSASSEAGELIGQQRDLANRSFEESQSSQSQGGESGQSPSGPGSDGSPGGTPPGGGSPGGRSLANEQAALQEALESLMERLGEEGAQDGTNSGGTPSGGEPGGDAPGASSREGAERALNRALRNMEAAEDSLRDGNFDNANRNMERAIERLREGAQALARAEAEQRRAQRGEGNGGDGEGSDGTGRDPLGRSTAGSDGGDISVPDVADPARSREVIEAIRKRLGEQGRSEAEIEYLERLLEAF